MQDWGGPIGLRWATENDDAVADSRNPPLNTGLFTGRVSKGFLAWRAYAEKTADLPVGDLVSKAQRSAICRQRWLAYNAPFPTVQSKAGAAQFPLLVPLSEDHQGQGHAGRHRCPESLDQAHLVAFSDSDPIFPFPSAGEQFCRLIPTAGDQVKITGASHFLQEDQGERVANEILALGRLTEDTN